MKIIQASNPLLFNSQQWQLISFLVLGLLIFALNSLIEVNFFVKHYLMILEIQTAIIGLYLISLKLRKLKKKHRQFIRK
jgi:hypothetical protein